MGDTVSIYSVDIKEVWKDIIGYEGYYQVSNMGRVRSLDRYVKHYLADKKLCKGKVVSHDINHAGYHRVTLNIENKHYRVALHRIVAEAFIPNPYNMPQINHKDENPHNNRADNLEWCTNSYNVNYGTRTERASSHLRKPVTQFSQNGNFIKTYASMSEAKRKTGCKDIPSACSGKRKQSGGYIWKYA